MLGRNSGGGTEERKQCWDRERMSRNPAHTLGPGKQELEFCMTYHQQNRWEQTPHTTPARVSPDEG